jgi:hypothetical protein
MCVAVGRKGGQGSAGIVSDMRKIKDFLLTDDTAVVSDPMRSAPRLTDPLPWVSVPRLPNTDVYAGG